MMKPRSRNKASIAFNRTVVAWVLTGFVLCAPVASASPTASDNPYHQIAERNVFGLRPPQPSRVEPPPAPLPKIVLTGITTILGNKRALLKVQFPAQTRQPAKEESCSLAEGQRDGPIEVLEINEKTAQVKVDNSGTVLVVTFEKPLPTPPAVARPQPRPNWPHLPAQAALRK
jgi:hypothetical protein